MIHFKKKDANPCIKHKLWGKLKERAKLYFRIFPLEGTDRWVVKHWSSTYDTYVDFVWGRNTDYSNLKDAEEQLERLRTSYFHKICENALYMRKCERVAGL